MGSGLNVDSATGPIASFLQQTFSSSLLGALSSSAASATATALKTGGMTTTQHNALMAVADGGTTGISQQWNNDGTEPSTLATMRSEGWIKLTKKQKVDGTEEGTYTLTAVGKALYARTGGGTVGSTGSTDGVSDATKQAVTDAVASIQSLLGGLGTSDSSGVSTSTTDQNASNILSGSSSTGSSSAVDLLA